MKLHTISSGFFYSDAGAIFGLLPKKIWSRHYISDDNNLCLMAMRCLIVITNDKKILIDTGVGTKQLHRHKSYRFHRLTDLTHELNASGISTSDITDVVLSHLHFDHCGYATQYDETQCRIVPTFPNATYHVSQRQWDHSLQPEIIDDDAYFPENMQVIDELGLLHKAETDFTLCDQVKLRIFNGHTPGQLVCYINDNHTEYVFAGDVIPLALNLSINSISAFDLNASESARAKAEILEEAAAKNQVLIFYHDAYTAAAHIKKIGNSFKIKEKIEF